MGLTIGLVGEDTISPSDAMSTSMGSLVGGVSLKLLPPSEDLQLGAAEEVRSFMGGSFDSGVRVTDWETLVDAVIFAFSGCLEKKFMRLFCFIFSADFCFAGVLADMAACDALQVPFSRRALVSPI